MSSDKSDLTVVTPEGTACFVKVFKAEKSMINPSNPPQFSMTLLFDKDADLKALKAKCIAAATHKFGMDKQDVIEAIKEGELKMPWTDAKKLAKKYGEPFEAGKLFIRATAKEDKRPDVMSQKTREKILTEDKFFSGCTAHALVYCHAYDTAGNRGVTLFLNAILKTGEGRKLSGSSVDPEKAFADLLGEATASSNEDDDDFGGLV